RTGALGPQLPRRSRRGAPRERHPLRTCGRGVDFQHECRPPGVHGAARWHGLGQCLRPFDHGNTLRRLQAVGLRARPLATRHREVLRPENRLDHLQMNASLSSPVTAACSETPEPLRRHIAALLDTYRPGFALPGAFFRDDTLYAAEMEYLFGCHWLFVASEPEIPEGGAYRTFQIGPGPIFILRRGHGAIAAFHNTC